MQPGVQPVFENSIIAKSRKAPWSAKVFFALLIAVVIYIVIFGCAPRSQRVAAQPVANTYSISGSLSPSERPVKSPGMF